MGKIVFGQAWGFPAGMAEALAAYGVSFGDPFWAPFEVHGDTRSVALPDGTVITESLGRAWATGYEYTATGVAGISGYQGSFVVAGDGVATTLTWDTSFEAEDTAAAAYMLTVNAGGAQAMLARLASHFAPVPTAPSR
jgi:hypothetical protein